MKKVFMIAALFIISALTICGCGGGNTFKNISLSEIETMLSDGETVFVLYAVEDCSACLGSEKGDFYEEHKKNTAAPASCSNPRNRGYVHKRAHLWRQEQ